MRTMCMQYPRRPGDGAKSLEFELQSWVAMWVPGPKPGPAARAPSAFNCWTTSPDPWFLFNLACLWANSRDSIGYTHLSGVQPCLSWDLGTVPCALVDRTELMPLGTWPVCAQGTVAYSGTTWTCCSTGPGRRESWDWWVDEGPNGHLSWKKNWVLYQTKLFAGEAEIEIVWKLEVIVYFCLCFLRLQGFVRLESQYSKNWGRRISMTFKVNLGHIVRLEPARATEQDHV